MKRLIIFILLVWSSTACQDLFFAPEPSNRPQAVFEQLWNELNTFYAPVEERNINWQQLYDTYAPQINATSSEDELYAVVTALLAEFDDGHVQLATPDREVFFANRIYREKIDYALFDKKVLKEHYLSDGYAEDAENENYLTGLLGNNILYVHFDHIGAGWEKLDDWISQNQSAKGLIIDLRHNDGGDFTYALDAVSYLTDQKRLVFTSRTKNGPGKDSFTPWHDWYISPKGTGFSAPIVVLIDRFTMSAAERATMALASLPNVTLVGERTNGSTSTMMARELPNNWYFSLSTQQVVWSDGQAYEGLGFPPDVSMKNRVEELAKGRDETLEKAIELVSQ